MILYSHLLYRRLEPALGIFERRNPHRERQMEKGRKGGEDAEIIVFGLGRYGGRLVKSLAEKDIAVLGVDFDPEMVRTFRRHGIPVRFGDAEDLDFPETLPLADARWVVSTLPQRELNLTLLRALSNHGYTGGVAVTAHNETDGHLLKNAGAHFILYPFTDAADFAAFELAARTPDNGRPTTEHP
jgi:Trk K+ transport system NAD-binding subunit